MTGGGRFKRGLIWSIGLVLGLMLILYPVFSDLRFRQQSRRYISAQKLQFGETGGDIEGETEEQNVKAAELYEEAKVYNASLVSGKRAGNGNLQENCRLPLFAEAAEDNGFGYIEVPAMDIRLPLFFGASDVHLSRGAAVLEGSSLPLGEPSSNTVIAGHRGYRGIPFFREIERLKTGNEVYVTTPWNSFLYRVEEIQIIEPSDTRALEIRPEKDMVTLMTCHPYLSGGKYRYVVYCIRDTDFTGAEYEEEETEYPENILLEWTECSDSRKLIFGEKVCRVLGVCGIGILFVVKIRRERRRVRET